MFCFIYKIGNKNSKYGWFDTKTNEIAINIVNIPMLIAGGRVHVSINLYFNFQQQDTQQIMTGTDLESLVFLN